MLSHRTNKLCWWEGLLGLGIEAARSFDVIARWPQEMMLMRDSRTRKRPELERTRWLMADAVGGGVFLELTEYSECFWGALIPSYWVSSYGGMGLESGQESRQETHWSSLR